MIIITCSVSSVSVVLSMLYWWSSLILVCHASPFTSAGSCTQRPCMCEVCAFVCVCGRCACLCACASSCVQLGCLKLLLRLVGRLNWWHGGCRVCHLVRAYVFVELTNTRCPHHKHHRFQYQRQHNMLSCRCCMRECVCVDFVCAGQTWLQISKKQHPTHYRLPHLTNNTFRYH